MLAFLRRNASTCFAFAVVLAGASCGSDKPGGKPKPPVPPVSPPCLVSSAAIAASPGCLADKDCPCGAYCELGVCIAGCAADADCASGESCDRFGRCRSATAVSLVPPSSREEGASLQMVQPLVYGGEAGQTEIRFIARKTDAGPIRIEGSAELEVSCDAGVNFARECTLTGATEGQEIAVAVRQIDDPGRQIGAGFVAGTIQVFQGSSMQTVGYATTPFLPDLDGSLRPPEPPSPPLPAALAGVYIGEVETIEQAIANNSLFTTPGQPVTGRPVLPIEARLHVDAGGSTGTLVLEDPHRTLHPTGEWVGELSGVDLTALTTPTGDAGELLTRVGTAAIDFPAQTAIEGPWSASDAARVVVVPAVGDVTVRDDPTGGITIGFDVVLRYEGVLPTYGGRPGVPQRRLRVTLRRAGDLAATAEAPAVPLPAPIPSFSAVVNLQTGWEQALDNAIDPWGGPVANNSDPFVRSWFLDRNAGRLEPCFQAAIDRPEVYRNLPLSIFQPVTLTTPSLAAIRTYAQSTSAFFVDQPVLAALNTVLADVAGAYPGVTFTATSDLVMPPVRMMYHGQNVVGGGYYNVERPDVFPCVMASRGQSASHVVRAAVTLNANPAVNHERPIVMPTCEELAGELGCTPVMAPPYPCPAPPCLTPLSYFYNDADPTLSYTATAPNRTLALSIQGTVYVDGCIMPAAPVKCDEYLSCYVDQATAATAGGLDLGAPLGRVSGDFVCESAGMNAALGIDAVLDLPEGNPARAAGDLFRTCLADLEDFLAAPPASAADPGAALGVPRSCIDPGRFINALAYLSRHARAQAYLTDTGRPSAETSRAVRLLQRWFQLHAYVAREAAQAEQLADILRNEGTTVAEPTEVLNEGLRAWNLLFHPRFALLTRAVPNAVFVDPDYRDRLLGGVPAGEQPYHEQSVSLAVAMLEAAAAQLELGERVMSDSLFNGSRARLGDLGALLSRIDLGLLFAQKLHDTAVGLAGAGLAWKPAYDRALNRVTAAYARVLTAMRAVDARANPFGIEDDDLPLYFLGTNEGPGGRFAAISDFLIGTGPGSTAWAPALVAQSQSALTAARTAWTQQQDRELAVMESGVAHAARVDAIRLRYGEKLADLCGRPDGVTTAELLDWETATGELFDPDVCYVDVARAGCVVEEDPYLAALTKNDVAFQLHRMSMFNFKPVTSTANLVVSPDEVVTYFQYCNPATVQYPTTCTMFAGNNCLTCATTNGPEIELPITIGSINYLAQRTNPPWFFSWDPQVHAVYEAIALATAMARYPTARLQLQLLEESPDPDPTCFRGAVGQQALTLHALLKDVQIAKARADELTEAYEIAMKVCAIEAEAAAAETNLGGLTAALNVLRVQLSVTQAMAASIKTCSAGAWVATALTIWAEPFRNHSCFDRANSKKRLNQAANDLRQRLSALAAEHARVARTLELDQKACATEADLQLVGMQTATLELERAMLELDKGQALYADLVRDVQAAYDEGRAAVAEALAEPMRRPGNDAWLSESIATYSRKFRLARRATYLAVRAVEYEFQMSLVLRGNVLAAEIPDDLDAVLDGLWAEAATRTIRGRRPADLKTVISLRDDLLQLADMSANGDDPTPLEVGYKNLSDVEKLRLLLADRRFEVYDDSGVYRGQRIPFSLAPLGRLELGDATGISVIAENDCAERLWSVNASILGEEGLYVGSATTFARIELHKKNTFYSQWCNVPAAGTSDFQIASVRPSKNLFHEPGLGADVGAVTIPEGADTTSARIEAYFNVSRAAFEADDYANGDTSELAARGLYGEYWLFFPASVLVDYDDDGLPTSDGLDLNKVTDVLLRLDYVSVARN